MADAELGFGLLTQPFDKGLNISIWMVRQQKSFVVGAAFQSLRDRPDSGLLVALSGAKVRVANPREQHTCHKDSA
ncbi:MAG TPA: hypothetical protein VHZ55_12300 [Bryobacteraceae bacterium]|nr:hypothetical protein [Bryobacteraceae bacterium]